VGILAKSVDTSSHATHQISDLENIGKRSHNHDHAKDYPDLFVWALIRLRSSCINRCRNLGLPRGLKRTFTRLASRLVVLSIDVHYPFLDAVRLIRDSAGLADLGTVVLTKVVIRVKDQPWRNPDVRLVLTKVAVRDVCLTKVTLHRGFDVY